MVKKGKFKLMNCITDTLWVEVTVESETTMALVQQLAALPVPSSRLEDTVGPSQGPVNQVCNLILLENRM